MITVASMILVIIGAINWLSVGIFDFNIVNWIFQGNAYVGARIIYSIVGIAGIWLIVHLVYNKFSARRLGAMEANKMMRDRHAVSEEK